MKMHSRCFVPLVSSGAPDGTVETDAECDARFEGEFMHGFDGAYFRSIGSVLTEEVARDGDYHTVTHPEMDPSLRGWIQIGVSKLLAAMANPALSAEAKSGALQIIKAHAGVIVSCIPPNVNSEPIACGVVGNETRHW